MSVEPSVVVDNSKTPMIVAGSLATTGSAGIIALGFTLLRRRAGTR